MDKKTTIIIVAMLLCAIIISSSISFVVTKNAYHTTASTTIPTTAPTTVPTTTPTTTKPPQVPDINELVANKIKEQNDERAAALLESKIRLSCDENGNFKTLVLADVHADGKIPDDVAKNIQTLVDREQPDLVIFTGDNTLCSSEEKLREALDSMVGYIESKGIAWCHVYGNHDDNHGLTKEQMQPIYESYEYCVSKWGDESLTGVGNYVLPVYKYESDEISSLVWCLDSGVEITDEERQALIPTHSIDPTLVSDSIRLPLFGIHNSPYDYIHADQIQWYYETSVFFEEYFGSKIPSIMAFHIPLPETFYAWCNRGGIDSWTGDKNEQVSHSQINSGLFTTLMHRGDVLAVVNGHDHTNDFMVEYKDIMLCYSPCVSTIPSHDKNVMGGRVFVTNSSNPFELDTYVSYLFK